MSRHTWAVVAVGVLVLSACTSGGGESASSGVSPTTAPPSAIDETSTTAELSTTSEPSAASTTAREVDEAVDLRTIRLPRSVTDARFPIYSVDGERILFSGTPAGGSRVEIMSVAENGSDLRCLSCGAGWKSNAPLLKAIPFADGARLAVRVGEQTPVQAPDHAVLECSPSVRDCRSAALVPIAIPSATDDAVVQAGRELRLSPDGETVAFSQVRRRPNGDNALIAVVGVLHRGADGTAYEIRRSRVVSTLGELKNFTPDGQGVMIAAFTTAPDRAANPDVVHVDLASGAEMDVTVAGDYDEDISVSPDQRWYVVASGRGSGLLETVSQVRRPNFIGPGLEPLMAYLFVNHRRELLEPWVVRMGAEQRGDDGQRLNPGSPEEGYDARVLMTWHPRGDRILFWEGRSDPFAPPTGGTRIVVAHLTDRHGTEPAPASPSPEPRWAPPLEGYVPPPYPVQPSRAGDVSGTVTVIERSRPRADQTVIEVRYDGFSDDGEWIIDGTESATSRAGLFGATTYTADLTVSGGHEGFLRAHATIDPGAIDGFIESNVDGRALRLP